MIAKNVYGPGKSAGVLMNSADRVGLKNWLGGPGHFHAVFNVLTGFQFIQWFYMKVDGNSLPDGPAGGSRDELNEFGLTHKKDINQLAVTQFNVGKNPDFIQQFVGQTLGFVDNQEDSILLAVGLPQKLFQFN
ncbi:MAG: hypothetical protein PVG51_17335 [Desulfosarcina sp.]